LPQVFDFAPLRVCDRSRKDAKAQRGTPSGWFIQIDIRQAKI